MHSVLTHLVQWPLILHPQTVTGRGGVIHKNNPITEGEVLYIDDKLLRSESALLSQTSGICQCNPPPAVEVLRLE